MFAYVQPRTKEEVLAALQEAGSEARIVAGCTNVLPEIKDGKNNGCVLIDISNLEELKGVEEDDRTVSIGSLTTINELLNSKLIENYAAVLWHACRQFADPLVRNRATIGGNLANASPAADGVVPLMALDAMVNIESLAAGKKKIPVADFFKGPGESVLQPGELITSVTFPKTSGIKSTYIKFGLRKAMAISLASIGLVVGLDGDKINQIHIALGALAPVPIRAVKTEDYLAGREVNPEVLEKAAEIIRTEVDPISDIRASKEYRLYLTGILLKRAIKSLVA